MPKLKHLTIGPTSDEMLGFCDVLYANQFPTLYELSLEDCSSRCLEALLNSKNGPVHTVKILDVPKDLDNPVMICQAARIFPNVNTLKVPGRKNVLKEVFQTWKHVKELTIVEVTGGESCDKLLMVKYRDKIPLNYRSETSGKPADFLQKLTILNLQGFKGIGAPTIQICYLVFLKMSSLRRLNLMKCTNIKIGEETLKEMRKQFLVFC